MKKRALSIAIATVLAVASLTGCGSKDTDDVTKMSKKQLLSKYTELRTQYDTTLSLYTDMQSKLNAYEAEQEMIPAIGLVGDGTEKMTFLSRDHRIVFPSTFQYPQSSTAVGTPVLTLTDGVDIKPSSSWIVKMNGSTSEFENSDASVPVSGTIKVGTQSFIYSSSDLKEQVLAPWFNGLPNNEKVRYSEIGVGGEKYGIQAVVPTTIDKEDAFLICGMLAEASSGKCVVYVFVYRDIEDNSINETVMSLVNSMTVGGKAITATIPQK